MYNIKTYLLRTYLLIGLSCFLGTSIFAQDDYNNPPAWENITLFGGDGRDQVTDVAANSTGSIFVAGHFAGVIGEGTVENVSLGIFDGFLVRIEEENGSPIWYHTISGDKATSSIKGLRVCSDEQGMVYVAGTYTDCEAITINELEVSTDSPQGYFIAKLDQDGNTVYIQGREDASINTVASIAANSNFAYLVLSQNDDTGLGIVHNNQGNFLNNITSSSIFVDVKASQNAVYWGINLPADDVFEGTSIPSQNAYREAMVVKTDISASNVNWTQRMGSLLNGAVVVLQTIALDNEENVYMSGYTRSSIYLDNGDIIGADGQDNLFVAKINSPGETGWALASTADSDTRVYGQKLACTDYEEVLLYYSTRGLNYFIDNYTSDSENNVLSLSPEGEVQAIYSLPYATAVLEGTDQFYVSNTTTTGVELSQIDLDGQVNWEWDTYHESGTTRPSGGLISDSQGNIFSLGTGSGFMEVGGETLTLGDDNSVLLVKHASDGSAVEAYHAVCTGEARVENYGQALATDHEDNILISANFVGTLDLGNGQILDSEDGRSVLIKLNQNLFPIWHKQFISEDVQGLVSNSQGEIFMSGRYDDKGFTYQNQSFEAAEGSFNNFLIKIDQDGNLLWAKDIEGSSVEYITLIDLDEDGNLYSFGEYVSQYINIGGTEFDSGIEDSKLVQCKFNPQGDLLWTKIPGSGASAGYWPTAAKTDEDGNCYVIGSASNGLSMGGVTFTHPDPENTNYFHHFLAKFNSDGEVLWLNPIYQDNYYFMASQIALDAEGNAYIGGQYGSQINFNSLHILEGSATTRSLYYMSCSPEGEVKWIKNVPNVGSSPAFGRGCLVIDNKSYFAGSSSANLEFDQQTRYFPALNGFIARVDNSLEIINISNLETTKDAQLAPNPALDQTQISFTLTESKHTQLRILAADGQLVQSHSLGVLTAGAQQHSIDTEHLSPGIYVIELIAGQDLMRAKLSKQ